MRFKTQKAKVCGRKQSCCPFGVQTTPKEKKWYSGLLNCIHRDVLRRDVAVAGNSKLYVKNQASKVDETRRDV